MAGEPFIGLAGEIATGAVGVVSGLADPIGVGVDTGLFGASGVPLQAPKTAAETAKAESNTSLLIVL